ncbi:hypothetical protein ENHYD8BJ_80373 [Enhydrobacter sp. 8BJ]|nr:hypothetical protein ENHYD8BJ_80373 [Enhydrobacter sp. 8BJ]
MTSQPWRLYVILVNAKMLWLNYKLFKLSAPLSAINLTTSWGNNRL